MNRKSLRRQLTLVGTSLFVGFASASAQELHHEYVVGIVSDLERGRPERGAGIVVGATDSSLYIVTAFHVLFGRQDSVGTRGIKVTFALRSDSVTATTVESDRAFDIAVIRIPRNSVSSLPAFDRKGSVDDLFEGNTVYAVGCPPGRCLTRVPGSDEFLLLDREQYISFGTRLVRGGNSGGALFNRDDEIIGMVVSIRGGDAGRVGRARSINFVMGMVEDTWSIPLTQKLSPPPIPRSGYPASLGATLLVPTSVDGDVHLPAGRATYRNRMTGALAWHVGVQRLSPRDVKANMALVGAASEWRLDRVTLRVFGEVVVANVIARFDNGGYTTAEDGYLPVYKAVSKSSIGSGFGLGIDVVAWPGFILEAMVGRWSISSANLPDLPLGQIAPPGRATEIPGVGRFHLGFGLRRAIR